MNYYNENDPSAAAWLQELIDAKQIPGGEIDRRSIVDVRAADTRGFTQCHFFAGIAGWSYALQLARWPVNVPVWTGSCPCQPFSAAGQQKGTGDARHLWPKFFRLIAERNPPIVFGEQVVSKLGREWLARVRADLEGLGYAVGAADLCAASVGAPHIRQRLYWVANACGKRRQQIGGSSLGDEAANGRESNCDHIVASRGAIDGVADAKCDAGKSGRSSDRSREGNGTERAGPHDESGRCGNTGRLANPDGSIARDGGLQPGGRFVQQQEDQAIVRLEYASGDGREQRRPASGERGAERGRAWSDAEYLQCLDGKARRTQPGIFPLAHGIPGRVGLLRGYGNAINPWLAAEFIKAFQQVTQ